MTITETLLAKVEAFLAETGMSESAFGVKALNDGKFVPRLRSGAGITTKTIDKVERFIAAEREKLGAATEVAPRAQRRARAGGFQSRKAA